VALPTWANLGPASGGTGSITVNWPNNYATNDIGLLICQSSNETVTETSGGWTQVVNSPQGTGTAGAPLSTRITMFWKRATGSPPDDPEPPAQLADAGDHVNGIIAVIRGCPITGNPIHITSGGVDAVSDTSLNITGPTTTIDECLVIIAACHGLDVPDPHWSGESAPNLSGLIERYDKSITIGNGGGTAIWSATLPSKGPVGNFEATGVAATLKAYMVVAFIPKPKLLNTDLIEGNTGPWVPCNYGGGGTFTMCVGGPDGTIITASNLAGIYISRDRGDSWTPIGNKHGFNDQFVAAVAFDPVDAKIIHAATSHGIYGTVDGGSSWSKRPTGVTPEPWIADILPAASDPNIVYAAYHDDFDDPDTGILKSTDRGLTFQDVVDDLPTNPPTGLRVLRLWVNTQNPDILYIVSGRHDFNKTAEDSIWKSTNSGVNWTRISGPLEALGVVWDCYMDRNTPTTLWATIYTGDPYTTPFSWAGSTHVSLDSGATWTQKSTHTGSIMVKYGSSNVIWCSDNKRNFGAAEEGFWESTDTGDTWIKKSNLGDYDCGWQSNPDRSYGSSLYGVPHTFGQDLSDPNSVYQISDQFVHGSFDGGDVFRNFYTYQVPGGTWTTRRVENLTIADIRISPANKSIIYSGAYDTGIWRSIDGGYSWEICNSPDFTEDWNGEGGNTCTIMPDPARSNFVWAAHGRTEITANLVKSNDTGEAGSWFATTGIPANRFVYGLSLDKRSLVSSRILFVTAGFNDDKTGGVYKSTDDGITWTLVLSGAADAAPRVTAIDAVDSNLIYAGGEGGFWRSTTGGGSGSWTLLSTPSDFVGTTGTSSLGTLTWTGVAWIEADPTVANRVYVCAYGTSTDRGLYRSDDRGDTWTKIYSGDFIRRCAIHPTNSDHIFVASGASTTAPSSSSYLSSGILRSIDGGTTWRSVNDNLAWTLAGPIAVGPGMPYTVFIGSMGGGFFKRQFDTLWWNEKVVQMMSPIEKTGTLISVTEKTGTLVSMTEKPATSITWTEKV